jgi:hypothetical protein
MNATATAESRAYDRGREAARQTDAAQCEPNWTLINRSGAPFASGFRYQWTQYVLPGRAYRAASAR